MLVVTPHLEMLHGHYHGALLAIAARGVHLCIRYTKQKWISADDYSDLLRVAGVDFSIAPLPHDDPDDPFARRLRELGNVLRHTHPDYAGRPSLDRALAGAPPGVRRWARRIIRLGPRLTPFVASSVARLEALLRPSQVARALIAEESPDAVVAVRVTAEHGFVDYLKAAKWQGISTAIWIVSWDNLTNKGLLHFVPDRVCVWNEGQAAELARYHAVPSANICITGAQNFDHWFDRDVPSSRAEFCSRFGVDQSRPIILYLGSSKQIIKDEPRFFGGWLSAIRSSGDPLLSNATVFVRPHPLAVEGWLDGEVDREPGFVVSPSTTRDPLNSGAFRREYRDELHHASVAVGLNTTGMIDAAIFGKPVCTPELPGLFNSQRGTLHFRHLVEGDSALLRTASTLEGHVAQLSELVRRDPYARDERSDEFVRAFVRPLGLDVEPSQVLADEMVRLCGSRGAGLPLRRRFVGAAAAKLARARNPDRTS